MSAPSSFDVVVAGGGPAGAAAALALARAGRRVLLADASPEGAFRIGEALAPAARPLLRDLGLLDRFLSDGHLRCHANASAWGSPELHTSDFIFNVHGHGWHLDRARFDVLLRDAAREAGAALLPGARIAGAEPVPGRGFRLRLAGERANPAGEGGAAVTCDGLIDATGRSAAIARWQGAARVQEDGLIAFFARYRSERGGDRDTRTLIEACPDGWWYTARVPSGERVVAYLTDGDLADRRALLSPDGFTARLAETAHIRALLAAHAYTLSHPPRGTDAGSAHLTPFAGPGWLSAGDAALSFDPLSSQGILSSLYTGMLAGQTLHAHLAGDSGAIGRYLDRLEEIHRAYRRNHAAYYASEARWPDRSFWRRRGRSAGSASAPGRS